MKPPLHFQSLCEVWVRAIGRQPDFLPEHVRELPTREIIQRIVFNRQGSGPVSAVDFAKDPLSKTAPILWSGTTNSVVDETKSILIYRANVG